MKKLDFTAMLVFALFAICAWSCAHKIDSTESLMKEIESRYYGNWFKQVKFSQTADSYENDSLIKSEIWDEVYHFPSNLRIYKTPDSDTTNGSIYRNDSAIYYENGVLTSAEKATHDAIILSMDIYNMKYDEIMKRWGDLIYDISKFHETVYNGKSYYVIGANEGDTVSNQIWFEAERLLIFKTRKRREQGFREMRLLNYMRLPDNQGWIEQEVEFIENGKVYEREKYFNIKTVNESK
jgi:hypothetical protein